MTAPNLPAHLQALVKQNKPSADVASLATAQSSTPRISLRGRMFRFIEDGEEKSKSNGPINVHIVGVEPGPGKFTKTWYEKAYSGQAADNSPPDCSSDDGVRPNPWIGRPQHSDCATCPKNMFGSATSRSGKPSKACNDSKRLYVTKENDVEGTMFLLQTPVSSLKAMANYGRSLADMGVELWMPVTQLSMKDAEFPELEFAVHSFITPEQVEPLKLRSEKKEWTAQRLALEQAREDQPRRALPDHIARAMGKPVDNTAQDADVRQAVEAIAAKDVHTDPNATHVDAPQTNEILKNW